MVPFAYPLWWNKRQSYVRCPLCSDIHCLPTPRGVTRRHTTNFHFSTDPRLQIRYSLPLSDYEIDKKNLWFVALGADPHPSKPSVLASLTENLNRLKVHDTHPVWSQYVDEVAKAEVPRGNWELVELFLKESSEAKNFLHEYDHCGNTAMVIAANKGYYDIVKLLLDFGAPINDLDQKRRTPLMWASLWGHYSIAQLLVDRGANKDLRDNDGFTAIDLANSSERNENERHHHPDYKGWTEEASTARKIIVNLLANAKVSQPEHPPWTQVTKSWFFERVSPLEFQLSEISQSQIYLNNTNQAVGILSRGGNYPHMATKSGWREGALKSNLEEILPTGTFWRKEAMRIAKDVGFSFPSHDWDETKPGQYHASHVEPKLIAFFISKHVFLPSELQENEALRKLKQATPQSGMLTGATILVNKPPCQYCQLFKDTVNAALGLDIKLINASISNVESSK